MRQFHDRGTKVTLGGNPPKPTQEEQREIWARDAEAKKSNSNSKIIGIVVLIIVLFNLIKMIF